MRLKAGPYGVMLVLPAALFVLLFIGPLINNFLMSLREYDAMTGIGEYATIEHYALIASERFYIRIWLNTLQLSLLAAILATALGSALSYAVWSIGGRTRTWMTFIVLAPLLISGVVRAYGWIATTGPAGALSQLSNSLGLGTASIMFSKTAVVMGFVHVFLPYSFLMIITSLDGIPDDVLRAARSLGASSFAVIKRVVLPLAFPGLLASLLLIFALSSAAYSIPAVLGGRRVTVAAGAIFQEQTSTLNWPMAAALATLLICLTVLVMLAYSRMTRRSQRRLEG